MIKMEGTKKKKTLMKKNPSINILTYINNRNKNIMKTFQ